MRKLVLFAMIALTPGCTVWTDWFPPSVPTTTVEQQSRLAKRVLTKKTCPVSDDAGVVGPTPSAAFLVPLLLAAAPFVASTITGALSDAAEGAKNRLTTVYRADGAPTVFGSEASCIIIVRGRFGPKQEGVAVREQGRLTNAVLDKIGATEQPSLYVEIRVTPLQNGDVLALQPVFIQFNQSAAENRGRGTKAIGIELSMTMAPTAVAAGASRADIAKASELFAQFDLGSFAEGTAMPSTPLAAEPGGARDRDVLFDQTRLIPVRTADGQRLSGPLNAYAYVTESEDPDFFSRALMRAAKDKNAESLIQKLAELLVNSAAGKTVAGAGGAAANAGK